MKARSASIREICVTAVQLPRQCMGLHHCCPGASLAVEVGSLYHYFLASVVSSILSHLQSTVSTFTCYWQSGREPTQGVAKKCVTAVFDVMCKFVLLLFHIVCFSAIHPNHTSIRRLCQVRADQQSWSAKVKLGQRIF